MANTSNPAQVVPGRNEIVLTEGALALVEEIVERTKVTDEQQLIGMVCEELERRFSSGNSKRDESYEYHLSQMHLREMILVAFVPFAVAAAEAAFQFFAHHTN